MSSQTEDSSPSVDVSQIVTGDQATNDASDKPAPPGADNSSESGPASAEPDYVTVNGERFFKFKFVSVSTEEHLNNLRNMPMREDDVIIAAYPKSGTHWLWEVTQMLMSGKADYDPHTKEQVMLEFTDTELFQTVPSPRVLNSHLHLRYLSKEIETKRSHVVHVLRNPKDIVVSLYHHIRQYQHHEDKGLLHFIEEFLAGRDLPGSFKDYFAYLPEMEKWEKEHQGVPFLNIYYEDMKESPVESVKQLAQFLGLERTDSFCAAVVDACSFAKLKQIDETRDSHVESKFKFKDADRTKTSMYRKGQVGDWKNHFTVALSEKFDAVMKEKLKDCAYTSKLRYTL